MSHKKENIIHRVLVAAMMFAFSAPKAEASDSNLRNWSILPSGVFTVEGARHTSDCGMAPAKHSWLKQLYLRRPGDTRCTAIVQIEPDGSASLNPSGFLYGPIPPLSALTLSDAEQLWGTEYEIEKSQKFRTYLFKLYHDQSNDPKNSDVLLDIVFKNAKVFSYRLRCAELSATNWCQVQQERQGD